MGAGNHHVDAFQQGAVADQFPQGTQQGQGPQHADAHEHAVQGGLQRRVLGGKGFHPGQHDAVGDDERDEDAQHQIQRVQLGIEEQIHHGHQGGDDQDEHRNADFVGNPVAQAGDRHIGKSHHQDGGEGEHHSIHQVGGHGQQGAQAENLDEAGVLAPDAVLGDFAEFFLGDHWASWAKSSFRWVMA